MKASEPEGSNPKTRGFNYYKKFLGKIITHMDMIGIYLIVQYGGIVR